MVKEKIKALVRGELEGWRAWEILWMTVAIAVIIGLSLYWTDTVMGIISSVTGVACVVCTGKGKLSAYLFGLVNCVLYAIIAYKATYYGETMLNLFYYVPMQFVGFFVWAKNMNPETGEVNKKHMSGRARILMTAIIAAATYAYGLVLAALGDAMPFVDSFTTVSSLNAPNKSSTRASIPLNFPVLTADNKLLKFNSAPEFTKAPIAAPSVFST